MNTTNAQQARRKTRISRKVRGTTERPRLSVYRSNASIYAQIIDDTVGKTIIGISEKELGNAKGTKIEKAQALGLALAKKAVEKKVKQVVFDKGSYKYHGRVKALADGVREGGLEF